MENTPLSTLDFVVIAAYFAVVLGVGLFMGRFVKSAGDFFSGGKRVPWWMGAVSSYMAMISSFVFIAYAQIGYEDGLVGVTVFWSTAVSILVGYARIFGSVEAYDRAYALYPSPLNAVTFCQANFKLMGADLVETARHFGKRIAFIHVRDVEGGKTDFTELFHDQGTTDQFALMRTYRELGLDVPVRGDHVPEMEGDRKIVDDAVPGYFTLGRLFANGYLKALLACP